MKKLLLVLMTLSLVFPFSSLSTEAAGGFTDVSAGFWAKDEISYISSLDIIKGYDDGTFRPNYKVTRRQAALIIGRALDIDTRNRPKPKFADVPVSDEAYPYISALTDEGVFDNVTYFNPSASLTRGQMAKILVNSFDITGKSSKVFKDVPVGFWAYPYVTPLVASGITTGVSNSYYAPNDSVSRAQMVVFIDRTLNYKSESFQASEILRLTNIERAKVGAPPLKISTEVQPVAMLKAKDMAVNGYFSHTSPTYGSPFDMLKSFGVSYMRAGENLFAGDSSPSVAVSSWMDSQGHRENMLNPHFTHMGVGYAEGGPYRYYWVQMFITK
ncbi:S-layer homology domain-containing protein [Bacillus sp. AK031]